MKHTRSKGYLAIELLIVLLVLVLIALGGWYVWQKNRQGKHNPTPAPNSQSGQQQQSHYRPSPTQKTFSFLDGKIHFTDDGTWKVATGGYFSKESGRCGRGVDPDEQCLDHQMLIPASETFTNPDQFQVNIFVFEKDGPPNLSLEQWVDLSFGSGTAPAASRTHLTLDGHEAYRFETPYKGEDIKLAYGILVEDKVVVIQSNFFKGNNYSYKSNHDYLTFIPRVDTLAKSISVM